MNDELGRVTVGGLKWMVRKGSSDLKALEEVVGSNSYERKGFKLGEERWVDLGANIGSFAVLAASRGAHVTAYEPDPDSFSLLSENIALNRLGSRVKAVNAAVVWDERPHVVLHVNGARKNYWRNSVLKTWKGGTSVKVRAVHHEKVFDGKAHCKVDIEGCEMPILEALERPPGVRLVFEWSFDVDPSIPRFSACMAKLRGWYSNVVYSGFDESLPAWPAEWFPPCRTVWCF